MTEFESAPLTALRVGAVLGSPVYDASDAKSKLLSAGVTISDDLLARLRTRGIETVKVSSADLAKLQALRPQGTAKEAPLDHDYVKSLLENDQTREVEQKLDRTEVPDLADNKQAAPPSKATGRFDPDATRQASERNENNVTQLSDAHRALAESSFGDVAPLRSLGEQSVEAALADSDLFACLAANPFSADYPSRHSLHVANLAIAIGMRLGLPENALVDLAVGCLVHDAGMSGLDEIYESEQRFGPQQIRELVNHPVSTLELLGEQFQSLSFVAQIVAFQLHERCDGSGYPRGRGAKQIHPLAKIAAVADCYVGLAANRPHRPGLQPYFVMAKLLRSVKSGQLDALAMRGLLRTLSMFPIGSYVQTSDDRVGRVIRSNGDAYDRPIVELWNSTRSQDSASVVDLATEPGLKVVRPLVTPGS